MISAHINRLQTGKSAGSHIPAGSPVKDAVHDQHLEGRGVLDVDRPSKQGGVVVEGGVGEVHAPGVKGHEGSSVE